MINPFTTKTKTTQEYKIHLKIGEDGSIKPQDVTLMRKEGLFYVKVPHIKTLSLTFSQDGVKFDLYQSRPKLSRPTLSRT